MRLALVCDGDALTYREYAACAAGLAHELHGAGIGAGARVVLLMGNSVDIAIATFGVQAAGAQVVPLNPGYTASELGADARRCRAGRDRLRQRDRIDACGRCSRRSARGRSRSVRRRAA